MGDDECEPAGRERKLVHVGVAKDDAGDAQLGAEALGLLEHLGVAVDRLDRLDPRRQRERELPGAAGAVQDSV